ncbi:hypothetical protein [Bacillus inaquosorum]|nr:hypothetical protein [Bacillus inaquosorum]MCY8139291.1 hypothetical protein [Bacillus inaquosorum]
MKIILKIDVFRLDRAESLDEHWQDRIHLAVVIGIVDHHQCTNSRRRNAYITFS